MQTQFHISKPIHIAHARALRLKAMGDNVLERFDPSTMDNDRKLDLDPEPGHIVHASNSREFVGDLTLRFDTDTKEIDRLDFVQAPGEKALPYSAFSYWEKLDGTRSYRFQIDGKVEALEFNPKRDTITAFYPSFEC